MRKLFLSFTLCLCAALSSCSNEKQAFQSVTAEEFANIIADTTTVILVDVRTAEEFGSGHIERAINIDVKLDDFEEKAINVLPKDKAIALYCRSGRRSKKAAEILTGNGYKVIELDSGYNGWTKQ